MAVLRLGLRMGVLRLAARLGLRVGWVSCVWRPGPCFALARNCGLGHGMGMQSKLGAKLKVQEPWRRCALLVIGLAVVLVDLSCFTGGGSAHSPWRLGTGLCVLLVYGAVCSWRSDEIGLVARPDPSLRFWVFVFVVLTVLSFLLLGVGAAWLWFTGEPLPAGVFHSTADLWWSLRTSVLQAPFSEELVYRLALCVPLVVFLGPWPAIGISGALFAFLHLFYGNFALNHVAAGFILSWAYVRSSCLWLPIALHASGNLLVVLVNVALMWNAG